MVNLSKKNNADFGSTAVHPPLGTYCRPRQGVWGGWETTAQPLDEWNLLWSSLIRILS
jgi:hypothetical protein